jgi:hypothetical protein
MTSYTSSSNSLQWPFVTIPSFEAQASQAIQQTGANYVGITPLVSEADKVAFEEYALSNQDWIQDALDYSGVQRSVTIAPFIFDISDETGNIVPSNDASGLYAPVSQIAPIGYTADFVNYNGFDFYFFKRVFEGMEDANHAILSEVLNLDSNFTEESGWPISFMAAPIYDKHGVDAELVAALAAEMPWHNYFVNLIPEGIDGIYLVVSNTCDQEFSYLINGPDVIYLGPGTSKHTAL